MARSLVYGLSKAIIRLILRTAFGFTVEGRRFEPEEGPVVVVSNHLSDLDPLVVGAALRRPATFMAKHELFQMPLLRWWITACGAFPVRRGAPDRRALRLALEFLKRGGVLVMFPEGTRGRDRALRPPEPGAALLALRTGAVILPVAVLGTDEVLPRDARRLRRSTITVRLGAPIRLNGTVKDGQRTRREDREQIEAVGRLFMQEIAHLLRPYGAA